MNETDPYDLQRFVTAQSENYADAIGELRRGRKETHWMWYVFPQVAGLGSSSMAQHYAIRSRAEAVAYLDHAILGRRLRECVEALLVLQSSDPGEVMGFPDNLKLKSSLTLFAAISPAGNMFEDALAKFYGGESDEKTLAILGRSAGA